MDGEGNYESDISDSWSLIDININEEVNVTEATEVGKTLPVDSKNGKLRKTDRTELDKIWSFSEKNESGCGSLSDSFVKSPEFSPSSEELEGVQRLSEEENKKNDSGDTDSIEILDIDGLDRDTDIEMLVNFDIDKHGTLEDGTYHSDDEDSFSGENINYEIRGTNPTVIRKRRRKLSRHSANVNGECTSPIENLSKGRKKGHEESTLQSPEARSNPVYKHYRNNVANTILSLSMGVIFAGVACIAIGHFLGVQDAAETVVELMEEIRKLQTESIALQSCLIHLNRDFITQEKNSKLELPPKEPETEMSCVQSPKFESTNIHEAGLNEARNGFPLNSLEWLSELKNVVAKRKGAGKGANQEREIDFESLGRYIHDQLNFINDRIEEGTRLRHLEESDKRISKELNSIMDKLSATQYNIKNLYRRITKLRDKLQKKVDVVAHSVERGTEIKILNKVPVRERDLYSLQWNPEKMHFLQEVSLPLPLYKYPQPESYYVVEDKSSITERQSEVNNTGEGRKRDSESSNETRRDSEKEKKRVKKAARKESERKEKKRGEKRKEKSKEKGKKEKRSDKRRGHKSKNVTRGAQTGPEKMKEKVEGVLKSGRLKYNIEKRQVNETDHRGSKHPKFEDLKAKGKATGKRKNSKLRQLFSRSQEKQSHPKKSKGHWFCSATDTYDPICLNGTGHWVFKWADGREEFRRHQTLSDWQFERAKKRRELRDEEAEENWQFKRAERRKELRHDDIRDNWQLERATAREASRDDRWHRPKYRGNYPGKGVSHERFSWM